MKELLEAGDMAMKARIEPIEKTFTREEIKKVFLDF